jgi:phosphoglycolate phosphatase
MNNTQEKAFIFDLDGTLNDSLTDIALCTNAVLKEFSLPEHKIEDYKTFVGSGADILIRNCTPLNTSENTIQELLVRFKTVYEHNMHGNTKPYIGVYELLDSLQKANFQIGILSNKPHLFTIKYVKEFFSDYNISEIHGQKSHIPKKPHPIGAENIALAFNKNCKEIYFITKQREE